MKREEVVRGLTQCSREHRGLADCAECPYKLKPGHYAGLECWCRLCDDALDLLKEQEPRVIDLSEISPSIYVWVEDRQEHTVFPLRGGMFDPDGDDYFRFLENVECDYVYWPVGNYGYSWRVWDKCPSPEQMEETPWEEVRRET